jgi:hypothetical protein
MEQVIDFTQKKWGALLRRLQLEMRADELYQFWGYEYAPIDLAPIDRLVASLTAEIQNNPTRLNLIDLALEFMTDVTWNEHNDIYVAMERFIEGVASDHPYRQHLLILQDHL